MLVCLYNETYHKIITVYFDSEVFFLHNAISRNIAKQRTKNEIITAR
jgi:hypothetical protein